MDSSKDVFVMFIQPFEVQSAAFKKAFEIYAKQYAPNKDLVFASVDLSANEFEGLKFKSLPTIQLYAKGKKNQPVKYVPKKDEYAIGAWLNELGYEAPPKEAVHEEL